MSSQFDDPDGRVLVLASEERPYSLWPESAAVPGGWSADLGAGHRTARLAYVALVSGVLLAGACA